ncbi:yjeF C-terminal region, hydroxyethylthiazole kinase-related/yjeF N-terminal region [Roseovarius lutimaris]|uniref:Bifunctional NAD(P)H-hydrate repair enzyme n=1 Tax=Roseovarius lutimaris TaxID=1005928 RepID=A0A1I5BQJ9_9RHOB|nr:NAD(P)H-hydrate dehydratase [Roseovarius lutimaris]SFN76876.1 yjeF C-terminal region, hydroxyethylthiazole kinase-related/yjeF N-terminal region [Roseovarius lutimaris]
MTELLTAAQMRSLETAAIESGEVTGLELMERAGRGVVEAVFEEWPAYRNAPQSVAILCGPGNNGGDGFVVARLLYGKGWQVGVFLCGDPEKLPPDAKTNYELWVADGPVAELSEKALRAMPYTLYIDALFGTGLTRPLEGAAKDVISHMAGRNGDDFSDALICIDAPSGLCTDSGRIVGSDSSGFANDINRFAKLTVAFDSPKAGHFIGHGPGLCGKLVVKDIGLQNWRCFQPSKNAKPGSRPFVLRDGKAVGILRPQMLELIGPDRLVDDIRYRYQPGWPWDSLGKAGWGNHKYSHGHALILSGGAGKTGAARLAARGALRIGAGVVTLGVPPVAQMEVAGQITALMLRRIEDASALTAVLADKRITALCLGPGMGIDQRGEALVKAALEARGFHPPYEGRSVVLDADALTLISQDEALFGMLHERCILTPHAGEFARLFPDIAAKLTAPAVSGPAYSKVDATREAAKRAGCVVLFKGPDTVIAAPSGACRISSAHYARAAPWLATAGSGDVLAGFITGLLARGFAPMQAAETAAWLHVDCALAFGPGLIAEDLPETLPAVLRALEV